MKSPPKIRDPEDDEPPSGSGISRKEIAFMVGMTLPIGIGLVILVGLPLYKIAVSIIKLIQ